MKTATCELLKTHQVVCKVLEGFNVDNIRFPDIMKTLHRTFLAHAWFQDEVLIPVLRVRAPVDIPFLNEIVREHKEIDLLMKSLLDTSLEFKKILRLKVLQIRNRIELHFKKEREALYPLALEAIDQETLNKLGEGMMHHQDEIREVAWN